MNEAAWRAHDLLRAYAARDRAAIVEHLAHLEDDQLEFAKGVVANFYNDTSGAPEATSYGFGRRFSWCGAAEPDTPPHEDRLKLLASWAATPVLYPGAPATRAGRQDKNADTTPPGGPGNADAPAVRLRHQRPRGASGSRSGRRPWPGPLALMLKR
ncbi:hypothetical protein ACWKT3_20445 [Streptomyces violaceus]